MKIDQRTPPFSEENSGGEIVYSTWQAHILRPPSAWWRDVWQLLRSSTLTPRFLPRLLRNPLVGFFAAVLLQLFIVSCMLLLIGTYPALRLPEVFMLFVVLLVALCWGAGPAILSLLVGAIALVWFFLPPYLSLRVAGSEDQLWVFLYIVVGIAVALLTSQTQRARLEAEQHRQRAEALLTSLQVEQEELRVSEERFRTIVQTANEGIWLVDQQGSTLYTNDRMAEMLGYSAADIVGQPLLAFIFPEDETQGQIRIRRNLQGETEQFEFRFRRATDSILYVQTSTSPVRDANGEIIGVLGLFTDITMRKQTEQALQLSEERLRVALHNSSITVYQQDRDLRYIWMYNPLPAFTSEMIVGKTDMDFLLPNEARNLMALKRHVLESGESVRKEIRVTSAAGVSMLELTIEPLRAPNGEIVGVTGCSIDLTERKQSEEERAQLLARALNSEYRFNKLFNAGLIGLLVVDQEHIIETNDAFLRMLGFSRAEMEAGLLDWRALTPPEYKEQAERNIQELVESGECAPYEKEYFHKDGHRVSALAGAVIIDHEPLCWITFVLDVTERRKLEQRTRRSLEALLEMAQVMVHGGSLETAYTPTAPHMQPLMQRLAELTIEVLGCRRVGFMLIEAETELMRPLAVEGLPPEKAQQWWYEIEQQAVRFSDGVGAPLAGRLRAGEIMMFDLTQPPYDTAPNPYNIHQMLMAPIILGGRLLGLLTLDYENADHMYTSDELAMTKGVTELAALVMEREHLLIEAAQARASELAALAANQLKDEFIGIASHELRTPLTTMKASVQIARRLVGRMLDESEQSAEQALSQLDRFLQRTEQQMERQGRLIRDLLDVSRIERGQLELQLAPCNLVAVVRETVEDQQQAAPTRVIQLELPIHEVWVLADHDRVSQVVSNYLSNALKYSDTDQPVAVSLQIAEAMVRVSVHDQGPGLETSELSHIWERFYRVPGTQVKSGSSIGLGLGLHISRTLIEQQGGSVGVESTLGHGATFWFTLPLQRD